MIMRKEVISNKMIVLGVFLLYSLNVFLQTNSTNRTYEVWDDQPAPNRGKDYSRIQAKGYPADPDWEAHSYPIGNGYMGANIFGRTDVERIQITEKTLANEGLYGKGGLTNFAEIYLDLNHYNPKNYKRSLNLNEAILNVSYENDGVKYTREYLANYPENVIAIKLSSDKKGKVSFTLRAEIPYRKSANEINTKYGKTFAEKDLITLFGNIAHFNVNYEGQIKIINDGGKLYPQNSNSNAEIRVENANSVVLLIAAGTNYELSEKVFLEKTNNKKLDVNVFPHEKVAKRIDNATTIGFETLKAIHLKDYQNLFSRVNLSFSHDDPQVTTKTLLENYKEDASNTFLEELMFHFGRYLLISSSRKGTLPCGLQGVWSQYAVTPWTGGYWHNINVQMNYWGAFSTNMAETFIPYLEYYKAYRPLTEEYATEYVKKNNPESLAEDGDNGWAIGTGATVYVIGAPGGHSGPGTGGFTSKLLWDRYKYTQDTTFLREIGYPALLSMSKFLSKTLKPYENGLLLVEPSASPEIRVKQFKEGANGDPLIGSFSGPHYVTTGTTFDQGFVWETYNDVLKAAEILGAEDDYLNIVKNQINRLDPILIGTSGQVKEYREENAYGEIGDPHHRHVSHLCPLYPGTLINSTTPEWMQGAITALDLRGNKATGWALAHRMNLRARTKDGEQAHEVFSVLIKEKTLPNLWSVHPPFQIDANLGLMAGVAEMLIQSHEGFIELLPALPKAWQTGSFDGLVARGNFEVSLRWKNSNISSVKILSKSDGKCSIKLPNTKGVQIKDRIGKQIVYKINDEDIVEFNTKKSGKYFITIK
jgi:alpha-L-fucosidase 2